MYRRAKQIQETWEEKQTNKAFDQKGNVIFSSVSEFLQSNDLKNKKPGFRGGPWNILRVFKGLHVNQLMTRTGKIKES